MNYIFADVFHTGLLDESVDERELCADALSAWGCCMAGAELPRRFGQGMAAISKKLGISATPESIKEYAIAKGWCSTNV